MGGSLLFYFRRISVQLVSGYRMVPYRHHPPGTPPSLSPILQYYASRLSRSGLFSSARYSPYPRSTKILFDLASEYSVSIVLIVSIAFVFITHLLNPVTVQCHSRSHILPNPGWSTALLFLACHDRFRRPLGYKPPWSCRRHHSR